MGNLSGSGLGQLQQLQHIQPNLLAPTPVQESPAEPFARLQAAGQAAGRPQLPKLPEPMPKESLSRTAVVAAEPEQAVIQERRSLASRAARILGYKHYDSVLDKKVRDERCAWLASKAFEKLGFDPLDEKKVLAYKSTHPFGYSWERSTIEKYDSPIPDFALSRAIELKQELRQANFEIEYLRVNPDPFLVMVYGDKRYYIDVWDEPKFEGRRTV